MSGLSFVDGAVIVAYFTGISWIGLRAGRGARTTGEFFMPRRFGKWMLAMATFGSGTSSEQAVSVASKCYTSGASGIWYQWLFIFATPFFWIVMPLLRRFRAVTMADIFEARFDRSVGLLFCAVGLLQSALTLGLLLKGTGAILAASSAGVVGTNALLVALTVSFLAYSMSGGLSASVITEFFQGFLTLVFSFLLLPFVLQAVGGVDGMKRTLADPARFQLFHSTEVGVFHVAMLTLSGLAILVMIPHNLGVSSSSRREADGQVGFVAGAFLKRLCVAGWCLTGLAGAAFFADRVVEPDFIYGMLAAEFLPAFLPGLLGLFIAGVLGTSMSTCSPILVAASALFANNLYRSFAPERPERHYITVGRIAMAATAAASLGFAFLLPDVVKGLEIILALTPIMGIVFWLGFFWRRTTPAGVWVATVAGYAVWAICESRWGAAFLARVHPAFASRNLDGFETTHAWQLFFILAATAVSAIVTSLLTRPVAEQKLDEFYALSRTPVQPGEIVPAPCTLPVNAVVPTPDWWICWRGLQVPRPGRRAWVGFLVCAGLVAIMILAFARILAG